MRAFAHQRINRLFAVVLLLIASCTAAEPVDQSASRVSVAFIEPEKFTDARRAELEPTSSGVLRDLENFLIESGSRYVPGNMKLDIRVTNIDLAGDFELFRGPQADQVRITKGLYPPHIVLEFEVVDSTAKLVKFGKRDLTDINYQLRSVYPREDYLRYEKDILCEWLREEFGALKSSKIS
jgi:hypothetical protein